MTTESIAAPGFGERLLLALFPARCGQVIGPEKFFCKGCAHAYEPSRRVFPLDTGATLIVAAPLYYRGGYREALHQYKFQGQKGLSRPLGRLMAREVLRLPGDFDGVAFVPLSKQGLRHRGYDQSQRLAKAVAHALGLPLSPLLTKVRDTKTQHTLGRRDRRENVEGAYSAGPAEGLRLLLIDDIVTTGATLCQCAQALYKSGAREVRGLCAANAIKRKEDSHGSL